MTLLEELRRVFNLNVSKKINIPISSNKEYKIHKKVMLPLVDGEAPKFSLISIIDQYLHNINQTGELQQTVNVPLGGIRKQGVFHPSEVCKENVCKRALAYELYSAPKSENIEARFRRIFGNGHFVHARLENTVKYAVESCGGLFYNEMRVSKNAKYLAGTTDGGIVLNGWPYLLEIKSMRRADFVSLGNKPWEDHQRQLNIYMHLAKVKAGFILVESKDSQDLKEFFVRYDENMWTKTEAIMDEVLTHFNTGGLPDKISESDGCGGKRCRFYSICKGSQNWEVPNRPGDANAVVPPTVSMP